jgi:hypothetical protein
MRDVAATYDGQGRKHPHKLTFLHYARSMPWLLAGFDTEVPAAFTAKLEDDATAISCPCGETPVVQPLGLAVCGCGRAFFQAGQRIVCNRSAAGM